MNHEPTEVRLAPRAVRTPRSATPTNVVDEAFATVTDADFRRDRSHSEALPTRSEPAQAAPAAETSEADRLTATLRDQLNSLDSQRRHLQRLLEELAD